MSNALDGLNPAPLWRNFADLAAVPRGSKNEAAVRAHMVAFASKLGLPHKVDATGNVLITKPGTKGLEKRPAVYPDRVSAGLPDIFPGWAAPEFS